jgi:integrase
MEILIKTRRTKQQGLAFDLDYRWNGQRYRPCLGYNLAPAEIQQLAIDMIQKIQATAQQQSQASRQAPTVRDLLPLFWETFQVKKRLDRTRPAGVLENHILSCHRCAKLGARCEHRFGHRPLASLTPEDGLRYVKARMEEGAAAGTIRREWQVFTRLLNLAVRYEKLDRNPLKHVDLPEADKRTRVAEAEELEALRTIKEKDPSKRDCRQELWRIIQVALNVGLREGKILAIERSWIKKREDGYWLCLPPASSRIKGNPKEVPLNRIALRALAEALPSMTDGRVFRHWTNARAFKGYWLETVRRVGIQDLRFHDLRHTFTTRLQRLGVDYELRQALLGHRMPGMTADYSHGGPEWDARLRDAVARLEKGYVLVYDLADERPAAMVVGAKYMKTGEPAGTRTQGPRLKRAMLYRLSYRLTERRARILPPTLGL